MTLSVIRWRPDAPLAPAVRSRGYRLFVLRVSFGLIMGQLMTLNCMHNAYNSTVSIHLSQSCVIRWCSDICKKQYAVGCRTVLSTLGVISWRSNVCKIQYEAAMLDHFVNTWCLKRRRHNVAHSIEYSSILMIIVDYR